MCDHFRLRELLSAVSCPYIRRHAARQVGCRCSEPWHVRHPDRLQAAVQGIAAYKWDINALLRCYDYTPLCAVLCAAQPCTLEACQVLLRALAARPETACETRGGKQPLLLAACSAILGTFLECFPNANVDARGGNVTALFTCVWRSRLEEARECALANTALLLDAGADPTPPEWPTPDTYRVASGSKHSMSHPVYPPVLDLIRRAAAWKDSVRRQWLLKCVQVAMEGEGVHAASSMLAAGPTVVAVALFDRARVSIAPGPADAVHRARAEYAWLIGSFL